MNTKKAFASGVAGVMLGGMALVGCGSSHHTDYVQVYDTHTHHYVVVTNDYYTHHRSLYSGPVTHHVHAPAKPKASKTPLHKKVKNAVQKHVAKKAAKRARRR